MADVPIGELRELRQSISEEAQEASDQGHTGYSVGVSWAADRVQELIEKHE